MSLPGTSSAASTPPAAAASTCRLKALTYRLPAPHPLPPIAALYPHGPGEESTSGLAVFRAAAAHWAKYFLTNKRVSMVIEANDRKNFVAAFPSNALAGAVLLSAHKCAAVHAGTPVEGTLFISNHCIAFAGGGGGAVVREDVSLHDIASYLPSVALPTSMPFGGSGPVFITAIPALSVKPNAVQVFTVDGSLLQFVNFDEGIMSAGVDEGGSSILRALSSIDEAWRTYFKAPSAAPIPRADVAYTNDPLDFSQLHDGSKHNNPQQQQRHVEDVRAIRRQLEQERDRRAAHDGAMWACAMCTFHNNKAERVCAMCGGSRDAATSSDPAIKAGGGQIAPQPPRAVALPQWPATTTVAAAGTHQRVVSQQQQRGPSVPDENSGWGCPACTFRNQQLADECDMCGTARPFVEPSHPSAAAKGGCWRCPRCTFANQDSSAKCEMCDQLRPPTSVIPLPGATRSRRQ